MMWNMDGGWGFGMGFGWIIPLALIGLAVWAVITLLRNRDGAGQGGGNALDILKERYARGELTREQFEAMRRDIE